MIFIFMFKQVELNYEVTQNYTFTITKTDETDTSLSYEQIVTINIIDVLDPVTAISLSVDSIDEAVDTLGVTLSQIIITDEDDGNEPTFVAGIQIILKSLIITQPLIC